MADEVMESPPEVAEETGMLADIARAAGVESFIESASEEESTEPEAEVVAEEEVDENEESDTGEPEATSSDSPGIKKRIGKLVERAEKAESEIEELKARIAEKDSSPEEDLTVPGGERFEGITDPKELDRREADAEHLREWLLENPEGGDYTDRGGNEYEVEYEKARRLMVETDRDLRKHIPSARSEIQRRGQVASEALARFPWMKDRSSPEYMEMASVIGRYPKAKKFYESEPEAIMFFGMAVEGFKTMEKNAKTETPNPDSPVPSTPTTSAPKRKKPNTKKELLSKVSASGSHEDAANYIESLL